MKKLFFVLFTMTFSIIAKAYDVKQICTNQKMGVSLYIIKSYSNHPSRYPGDIEVNYSDPFGDFKTSGMVHDIEKEYYFPESSFHLFLSAKNGNYFYFDSHKKVGLSCITVPKDIGSQWCCRNPNGCICL